MQLRDVILWHSRGMCTCGLRPVRSRHQSIRRGDCTYLIDLMTVRFEILLFDQRLYRGRCQSWSLCIVVQRVKDQQRPL